MFRPCWLHLATILALLHVSVSGHASHLLTDAGKHLGLGHSGSWQQSAVEWKEALHVSTSLEGSGFHRTLLLSISGPLDVDLMHGSRNLSMCGLAALVPLPSELFIDPYQLENEFAAHHGLNWKLFGSLDLEQ